MNMWVLGDPWVQCLELPCVIQDVVCCYFARAYSQKGYPSASRRFATIVGQENHP